jgi:hypothetical protein
MVKCHHMPRCSHAEGGPEDIFEAQFRLGDGAFREAVTPFKELLTDVRSKYVMLMKPVRNASNNSCRAICK